MQTKLEVVPVPVTDVDPAKAFYTDPLGFVLDVGVQPSEGMRVVQPDASGDGLANRRQLLTDPLLRPAQGAVRAATRRSVLSIPTRMPLRRSGQPKTVPMMNQPIGEMGFVTS